MAAKKKKSSKAQSEHSADAATETAHIPVPPPVEAPIVTETHAPILSKQRKKKNKFSNPEPKADVTPLNDTANVKSEATGLAIQLPSNIVTEAQDPVPTAPRKKKKKKTKSANIESVTDLHPTDITVDEAARIVHSPAVQPSSTIATDTDAPKPRKKKKKNKSGNVEQGNDAASLIKTVHDTQTAYLAVQPPRNVEIVTDGHAPILSKQRKKKKNKFSEPEPDPRDEVKLLMDAIDHVSCSPCTEGSDEAHFVVAEARTSDGLSPTQSENERHWGFLGTNNDDGQTLQHENTDAPVNFSVLQDAGKTGVGGKGENGGKQFGFINIARQEALEAVSEFKTRILERAAKKALNDTPFTPSPYPNDMYLYDKADNTPEDTAMLKLKLGYDAAIMELDLTLAPVKADIPLNIAKRLAMYISGLLQSHDGQFRCALDSLREPLKQGQPIGPGAAPWLADTWEERLLDSDRDWLLGKKIDDMSDDKARSHVVDCMEFITKYKIWGHMVEAECAEMGVRTFPRLD